jgi:regulator of PEP synthase PpsR (kinase-PPPase family)
MRQAPVYVVSGGTGFAGEHLVNSVTAQFEGTRIPIVIRNYVRQPDQVRQIVREAAATGGTILHTLVNAELRELLLETANQEGVSEIDAFGPLLHRLADSIGQQPVGRPGLYRLLHSDYFTRVDSIDFAIAHDDGRDPDGWKEADVVVAGASRAGKTPLTMYMAVLGWRVANVPLVPELPFPEELLTLDRRRVFCLEIEAEELLRHRRHRQRRLTPGEQTAYTQPRAVFEELAAIRQLARQHGFTAIEVTNKPVESTAQEIVEILSRRFGGEARRG